ncbi:arylesterase [Caenimonas sedimenti]|uniref:Arylesterase n=1 Tax=Caenimonas sedimenti TaxID=2596921 RepID=A0A562ZM75_9BURK|nr:GDSL-type esterase/lipase family protein [Caenimonas sedimenti]TWO69428.1 arylesterase [Caenimonas sedimenti]
MPWNRRIFLTAAAAASLAACSKQPKLSALPAGAPVLALGDSITFGTGATPETSYPTVLAKLTGWNIVNAGVPGDTSLAALKRLPALLQEHAPRLVLVSIGGNDFLRGVQESETRTNVRAICQQCAAAGAQVVLVAIPGFSALAAATRSLSDHALYAELAQELKIPVHASGWAEVLSDASLRSDPIHANARGYEVFARGLAETLRKLGLTG